MPLTGKTRTRSCHERHHHLGGGAVDAAPYPRPYRAAPAHRRAYAAAARRATAHQNFAERGLHPAGAGHCHHAAVASQAARHARHPGHLPARQLARPLWHRAGARQAIGHDAGAVQHRGPGCGAVRQCTLAPGRGALSPAVSVPAHGAGRGLPHGRSVQPVCVLRDHAGRLVRAAAARLGAPTRGLGPALHRHQSGRFVAVSDWRVHALRHHRHAQHGRPGTQHGRCGR